MGRRLIAVLAVLLAALPAAGTVGPAAAQQTLACPELEGLEIPEAQQFTVTCLGDLTTLGNPRTDQNAAAGGGSRSNPVLHSKDTDYTDDPVPGIQIDGFFPDSCDNVQGESTNFIPRCSNGLRRNGQFAQRGMKLVLSPWTLSQESGKKPSIWMPGTGSSV